MSLKYQAYTVCIIATHKRYIDLPMNEAELVNGLNGKNAFGDIESGHIFRERVVFDEHGHEIATREKLHNKIQILWILKGIK
jgi:hypothetical protein